MKLTPEQIEQLYAFTRQHYVEYYDLQTELVDHLANAIEEQWQTHPEISFETALDMEFKKFGVFGFEKVVSERERMLRNKYYGIIWNFFVEFYKLPKIIVTIIITYFVYLSLSHFHFSKNDYYTLWLVLVGFSFLKMFIYGFKQMRRPYMKKVWLFERIIRNSFYVNFLFLMILKVVLGILDDFILVIYNSSIFMSFLIVSYLIFVYTIFFMIPSKAEEYLKETYPEYEISKQG